MPQKPITELDFDELSRLIAHDDGAAAKAHLAAGHPIYYREPDTPAGLCIKEYPNGSRELVTFDRATGKEVFVRFFTSKTSHPSADSSNRGPTSIE